MLDIAIIGGGLSGLFLARGLMTTGRSFSVFESRDRFGGRILSSSVSTQSELASDTMRYDLGPSWIWPDLQPRITQFLADNNISVFPQWTEGNSLYHSDSNVPPQAYRDESPYGLARRIPGGTYRLIETLLQQLPTAKLHLNFHLVQVVDQRDYVELHFKVNGEEHVTVKARQVVVTVPPRLLLSTVRFSPEFDARFSALMNSTPTWMAGHAKAIIRYERAFWREVDLAGNALAVYPGAVLAEIFDACSADGKYAALAGFFALPVEMRRRYRNDLDALILNQLTGLFGREAAVPAEILIKDWSEDALTAVEADAQPPATHPQYGHAWFQLDHWNGKLYFSGTETAPEYGGYLEGALVSAERVQHSIMM